MSNGFEFMFESIYIGTAIKAKDFKGCLRQDLSVATD